jgi:predicted permease
MSLLARFRSWLRAATSRSRLEREMDEELAFHLESYTSELIRRGLPPEEAARRARIELGGTAIQKEHMRASLGLRLWDDLRADLRYAVRMLAKSPGFTAIAIGSLALGIGANIAIFSMARTALFQTLPIPHPAELRQLHWTIHGTRQPMNGLYGLADKPGANNMSSSAFSTEAYRDLRESPVFRGLIASSPVGRMEIAFDGDTQSANAQYVSGNFFSALGLTAEIGRLLLPSDDLASGKSTVVVLSDAFWESRFARSPAVIGKTVEVNRVPLTIVGVAQRGFTSLEYYGRPHLYLPLSLDPLLSPGEHSSRLTDPETWWLSLYGRISPGVTNAQAQSALAGIFHQTVQRTLKQRRKIDLDSMRLTVTGASRGENPNRLKFLQIDSVLAALAFLVLLLACANLANLLLARAAARQKEVSLRIALGAGRGRILRQVVTENLLLAISGGGAGTALGYAGRNLAPPLLGQPAPSFDLATVGFALGLSLLTCLLFGSVPAWRAIHADAQEAMRETSQMTARRSRTRMGKSLVIVQIALSVILVAGAGLFLQTLHNLLRVQLGFQPERLLLFNLSLTPEYKTSAKRAAAYESIAERLEAIPGTTSASYSTDPLIADYTSTSNFDVDGEPEGERGERRAWMNIVGSHFFQTMGIPLMEGRSFGREDTASSQPVAIVNQQLAHDFFPGKNPVGQTFKGGDVHAVVVGICGNTRFKDLRNTPPPTFYLFSRQIGDYGPGGQMTFAVKTASAPASIAVSARKAVGAFDRNLPVYRLRTQEEQIDESLHAERLFALLTSGFGVLALVLACIGIYGIMAYTVARRTNEIGIRLALGAPRRSVMTMVLSEALTLSVIGVLAGMAITLLLTRSLQSMLFGLKPYDPLTLVAAALLLSAVALLASFLPARAAARVDPIQALRRE